MRAKGKGESSEDKKKQEEQKARRHKREEGTDLFDLSLFPSLLVREPTLIAYCTGTEPPAHTWSAASALACAAARPPAVMATTSASSADATANLEVADLERMRRERVNKSESELGASE